MNSRREPSRFLRPRRGEIGTRRLYMSRSHRTELCSREFNLDRIPLPERSSSMRRLSSSAFGLDDDSSNIDNMDEIDASDIEFVTGRYPSNGFNEIGKRDIHEGNKAII
ncbi:hypothetical protein FRACYDRAFT_241331 [Fragilariopsis cylindrus CCMP1102]|uniref:Uncharacterized protein n=1 Tax=Fragilariopsis cylindrus CCMP1102 TaxID=635003 RepID=A0A1E7F9F3_9STRA|nr:hypothetical protein FRACYDRAFT_241331 [Fragilariopsis cylindrus CCMP1102]|eukprot:OEU14776.1 hypothetical protein FRACYDRAFT_241331 [Fragilariopsis cylindrus CCMP1102]